MVAKKDELVITQEAYDEFKVELKYRTEDLRDEIAKEIAEARELGDLSENYAYSIAMEKKEINENRILELEDMIKNAKVVKNSKNNKVVRVGTTLEIENLDNATRKTVTLVGSEESKSAEPGEGKISSDSPIGSAILNAREGDVVTVKLPTKDIKFKILKLQ